jgi:hypothetical protein
MYSKGVSWIDDCRIPTIDNLNGGGYNTKGTSKKNLNDATSYATKVIESDFIQPQGRFPANILVSDDMLNDGKIDKKGKTKITQVGKGRGVIGNHDGRKTLTQPKEGLMMARTLGDGGSNSRYYNIDKWFENLIK